MGDVHNTLIIDASVNKCGRTITLSWNAYCGMPDSITGYRILVSTNGGTFTQIGDVPDNQRTYTHNGVAKGKYIYTVQAYNSKKGYSGTSAKKEVDFIYEIRSDGDVQLRYVSVADNQDIEIAVFAADTLNHRNLFLYKSDNNKATFSHIDTKSKINGEENYFFTDNNVNVQAHTYFYIVAITDECDNIFAYSADTANNVVLEMKVSQGDEIAIAWKPYYGFDNRLDSYDVYRRTQTESVFQLASNVPATQLDYTDKVRDAASGGGKFYYQVSANENNTNIYGFQDKSYSNIVEASKEAITYIPNMFSPSSPIEANRVFKPVNSYVDAEEYIFSVYDRWGSLIFTTTDINAGWDGTVNGNPAAAGVYAYTLTYRLDKKNIYNTRGRVTLVR
jgi:gliding motility-associated-like protein